MKLREDDICAINAFEELSHAKVVNYLYKNDTLYFVIDGRNPSQIIGRNGENIKNIQKRIGKKIKIFQYSKNVEQFIKNLLLVPINDMVIVKKEKVARVKMGRDSKALVIGRGGKNIEVIRELLKREFNFSLDLG